MKAIYFSPVKIAGQGVVVFFPLHRQSDTGNSGARAEIKTMSQRIQPGRVKLGANKHSNPSSILKSPMTAVVQPNRSVRTNVKCLNEETFRFYGTGNAMTQ